MKSFKASAIALAVATALTWAGAAQAHCDTLDGPVVSDARKALDSGNIAPVLTWVPKKDEAEVRSAFQKASAVRKAGGEAKQLADSYFFETLVRVHRAGEGAPYTGLKPAGQTEPPVAAADNAIQSGKLQGVAKLLSERTETGLHERFESLMKKKQYRPGDVEAGRAYRNAYVEFVHYVEGLYDAAAPSSAHGQPAKASADGHASPTVSKHAH